MAGIFAAQRRRHHNATVAPGGGGGTPALTDIATLPDSSFVVLEPWADNPKYNRYSVLTVLDSTVGGATKNMKFFGTVIRDAHARALTVGTYTLLIDGEPIVSNGAFTTVDSVAGAGSSFTFNITDIPEGWRLFDIQCPPGERALPHYVYVKKTAGTVPSQDEIPVHSGMYDVQHETNINKFSYGLIPNSGSPTAIPAPTRTIAEFSNVEARTNLYLEYLVPLRAGDIHRRSKNKHGIYSTANSQAYHWNRLVAKYPEQALLDGPRGVGTVVFPTHIKVDRHGGAYCCDPWRVFRVSPEGWVTTRCGYKHTGGVPTYYADSQSLTKTSERWFGYLDGDQQALELVGDWSAIPTERHGFHELWGLAFDEDSLALNEGAPTIFNPTNGENEHPHIAGGPRLFVSDTQNNRVCLLTFSPTSFTAEPVVTEFLTDLADPWDVVWYNPGSGGRIIVSERLAHRIVEYDAVTGSLIRVIVQGAALAFVDFNRFVKLNVGVTPAQVQAEDVVAPEGLFIQDGWLYYGAIAMKQVKRVHLTTGEIQLVVTPFTDQNSNFIKLSMSDGTFGPRGTIFVSTWSDGKFGRPEAWLPPYDGTRWTWHGSSGNSLVRGRGGIWDTQGYGSSSGVGMGRIYVGSSFEGLAQITKFVSGETAPNATTFNAGRAEFEAANYHLIHGKNGWGYHGYPLPWGQSSNIDYYLEHCGHTPPA